MAGFGNKACGFCLKKFKTNPASKLKRIRPPDFQCWQRAPSLCMDCFCDLEPYTGDRHNRHAPSAQTKRDDTYGTTGGFGLLVLFEHLSFNPKSRKSHNHHTKLEFQQCDISLRYTTHTFSARQKRKQHPQLLPPVTRLPSSLLHVRFVAKVPNTLPSTLSLFFSYSSRHVTSQTSKCLLVSRLLHQRNTPFTRVSNR